MTKPILDLSDNLASQRLHDYLCDRLSPELRADVEQACSTNQKLAEELAYYQGLDGTMQELRADEMVNELGWARLSRAIDESEQSVSETVAANDNSSIWRFAACALGALLVAQTGWVTFQGQSGDAGDGATNYFPVTEPVAQIGLQVSFSDTALEADIRSLLLDLEADIVAGPSSLGIYELNFLSEDARSAAVVRLENEPDLIAMVSMKP
ncbi:MAG: hypothetical protein AAGJ50_06580 [Pseudomonadota bacterium]